MRGSNSLDLIIIRLLKMSGKSLTFIEMDPGKHMLTLAYIFIFLQTLLYSLRYQL